MKCNNIVYDSNLPYELSNNETKNNVTDLKLKKELLESQLFHGITYSESIRLLSLLDAHVELCCKGDYLFKCCTPANDIVILISGLLQGLQFDDAGNRSIIQTFRPIEVIGLPLSFGFEALYMNVVASKKSTCLFIPAKKLESLSHNGNAYASQFLWNILGFQALSGIGMKTRISILSKRNTKEKILYYLKKEAQYQKKLHFIIPLSRQELADYLFVERTALSHQLSKLQKENYFTFSQNEFTLNPEFFSAD